VLSGAPYGYRYIGKRDGGGCARYQVDEEEARIVRLIFGWVGRDRVSIGEVCRRLQAQGYPTRGGKRAWDRTTVWGILKNPAYAGAAAFGKTRVGPRPVRLRPVRGGSEQPRRSYGVHDVPPAEWLRVPVTARRSACGPRRASRAPMPTTAAAAATPTASAASACARTRRCARTGSTRRSGTRSSGCCGTRPGSRPSTNDALMRRGSAAATVRSSTWSKLRSR